MTIKKMIEYFLLIAHINKINICMFDIKKHLPYSEIYSTYSIYFNFISYLNQRHFNISKIILYITNLAISLLITLNRSVMT